MAGTGWSIRYDGGEFTLARSGIYVPNLGVARAQVHRLVLEGGGSCRDQREWRGAAHEAVGWYNTWHFQDLLFAKGVLLTLRGETQRTRATYCNPSYVPRGEIPWERRDRKGRLVATNRGIRGRIAGPDDRGTLEIVAEGYRELPEERRSPEELLALPLPPYLMLTAGK